MGIKNLFIVMPSWGISFSVHQFVECMSCDASIFICMLERMQLGEALIIMSVVLYTFYH